MKYVDPDGREDVYSYKYGNNKYGFSADCSTIEGAIKSLYGVVPFIGGKIHEGIGNLFGFKTIDKNSGYERVMSIASPILDLTSNAGKIADIAKISGSVGSAMQAVGKIAGWVSYVITACDMLYNLSKSDEVAVNSFIDIMLGGSLISNSHENVAALYSYARNQVGELMEKGSINITHDKLGGLTSYSYNDDDIRQLRTELKILNKLLQDE